MTKSKAGQLLESLTQYRDHGDVKIPTTRTNTILEAGIYKLSTTMQGEAVFSRHNLVTDKLLRFQDERQDLILAEVAAFWDLRERFKALGLTHKRGMMLHGPQGSGKSCILKLVMNDIVERGDVVFIARRAGDLRVCLDQFRKVEPERRAVVVLEDVDEMARYDEHTLLEMLDGDDQVDGVLFLGTTNYLHHMKPRFLREGRFDRKLYVPFPPLAGRVAYLQQMIGLHEKEDPEVVQDIAEATDGFSFGQLREFLVSVYVYGYDPEETIERIANAPVPESLVETTAGGVLFEAKAETAVADLVTTLATNEAAGCYGMTPGQKASVKKAAKKKKAKKEHQSL
jgi:SpoVK/Ycf46/Vps4 family AAA+-type ATPase